MLATSSATDPLPGARRLRGPRRRGGPSRLPSWALGALLAACGCGQSGPRNDPPLSSRTSTEPLQEEPPLDFLDNIPVPPADGPKLAPLEMASPVYAKPDKHAEKIGYLRLGARLARSEDPVSLRGCAGGWYAVRPLGFACADEDTTLHLDHPIVRALDVEPDRSRPMPYAYAFARAIAPNYMRIPTEDEQLEYELRLDRHLRNWRKLRAEWDVLDVGANDVQLDAAGLAKGPTPEQPNALDMSRRYGGDGTDTVPWWLDGERRIPNVAAFDVSPRAVIANRVERHAGVALIGSFVAGEAAQARRFAITTDGRLLPADKLKVDSGSTFHGQDLRGVGLPVAFGWRTGARYWEVQESRSEPRALLERREIIPLTGSIRQVNDVRMVEARDGRWLRSEDLRVAVKPRELPWFATGDRRWIDISIGNQIMLLWEGAEPVYATLVSTGRDGMGDPRSTSSTPLGVFRILQKHVTTTMDSNVADNAFELRDVPWVMYFKGGYALHGAYWHDDFGRMRSHGCVNLSPIDARYTFEWSLPNVPEHWHGAYASGSFGSGTIVRIGR
jgi:L,D-transpeptidase catalytic domain